MRGGYKIIDLKDVNLIINGAHRHIAGIYDSIEGNYYKPTMLCNITINGLKRCDRYAVFGVNNSNYEATIGINGNVDIILITITSNDEVYLTQTN